MMTLDDLPEFKQRKVFDVMGALEDFVEAKVEYMRARDTRPDYVSSGELDRARKNLQEKLVELVR